MNNLAPMKNCPGGVQGNLNWMPGYSLRGYIFQKLLLARFFPVKTKCFFVKETDTFGHIVV